MNLVPMGRIAYADENELLPRIGRREALEPWAEPLQAACMAVRDTLAGKVEAVLLRGSIPRGTALAGASDIDLVIIHAGEIGDSERERLRAHETAIAAVYPAVTEVELLIVPEAEFWSDRKRGWLRFILSHQGLTLDGNDLIGRLPPPRLDSNAVAHDRPGARWTSDWPGYWHGAETDAERRAVCAWLMKRYVRSAFERIMFDVNGYTRDLYPAAEAVSDRCPTHADAIWEACRLAVFPSAEREIVHSTAKAMQALLDDGTLARRDA